MKTLHFPILYFELSDDAVLGILVGTKHQMVGKDLRTVKSSILEYLQKRYKKVAEYIEIGLEDPRFKMVEVKVRPREHLSRGTFVSNTDVKVPLAIVYGEEEEGQYVCHMPMLNEQFFYYEQKQLKTLINYFATDHFNRMNPEEIYRHLQYPVPKLDTFTMKVKEDEEMDWDRFKFEYEYTVLPKLAEKYPYAKAIRKNQSRFPEAAWELEQQVIDVADYILKMRTNVLVVGKHGVGKSAVLKAAIRKITSKAKKEKFDISFWRIRAQRITASSKYLGEWQKSVEDLLDELSEADGILWVEDVVQLLRTGGESPEDSVAAFMINFLRENDFQIIGEVTHQELESIRRFLPGFSECFQIVNIEELSEKQVYNIMNQFADFCQKNLKVRISKNAVALAYRLLLRYYPYESFPGKAVRFLEQCVNDAHLSEYDNISSKEVIKNFTQQTGLPKLFLRDDLLLKKGDLDKYFLSKIIGQPDAIQNLTDVITVFKAGLNNPKKPIQTMLFAGPTGVGKTQSAKALAEYFFGKGQTKNPLVRIDMSEFQHPSQIIQLIGGGKNVGKLVEEIREKPFAVLLLDEVEKADPSIFDALLTVLDEGILVDAFGRVTNFRNTIVIMTTNLGASNRKSVTFKDTTSAEDKYMSAISGFFRPEFVNRIDSIVMFNALKKEDIQKITMLELEDVKKREGIVKRKIKLHFSEKLIERLLEVGFDEKYGARPLQRAIEQEVVTPLAGWFLGNPELEDVGVELSYEDGLRVKVKK
jgi:ATP-dependent Clp protease ATP-binding subunit ClpC